MTIDRTDAFIWSADESRIDGRSDVAVHPHEAFWERDTASISFSFTADDVGGRQGLVSKDASDFGDGGHLGIWIDRGRLVARLQSETDSHTVTAGSLSADETHDVVFSFGEGGMRLFLDGALVGQDAYDGGLDGNREPIVIGANQWASTSGRADNLTHHFDGTIGPVFLSASERPMPGPESTPAPAPVVVEGGNVAPASVEEVRTVVMTMGEAREIDLASLFTDANGDDLSFKIRRGADFAEIDGDELRLAPGAGDGGEHVVALRALDGRGGVDGMQVRVLVEGGSDTDAPRPTPTPEPTPTPTPTPEPDVPAVITNSGNGGDDGDGRPSVTGRAVTLEAGRGVLDGPVGDQLWGDSVTLAGYGLNGNRARVVWSQEFSDEGFGVADPSGRWDGQIDFFRDGGNRSEAMVIDFAGGVTDLSLRLGMLGVDEGLFPRGDRADETGQWTAYDERGREIGTGLVSPALSDLGPLRKEGGSYGTYPFEVDVDAAVHSLRLEATAWEHGNAESRYSRTGEENNSDFALMGVTYTRIEDTGADLF